MYFMTRRQLLALTSHGKVQFYHNNSEQSLVSRLKENKLANLSDVFVLRSLGEVTTADYKIQ